MSTSARVEPNEIGWMFVPQYYTFVNKEPQKLHCFYTKKSTLIHGTEGEDCQPRYGQQEIHDRILALDFQDCRVYVSNVDSQSSAEGGIIVQVLGEISNKNQPWRKFAQTFFLAEQTNGYFVLNDIFRYLKEDEHEDEESATSSSLPPSSSHVPDYNSGRNGGLELQGIQSDDTPAQASYGMPAAMPRFSSSSSPSTPRNPPAETASQHKPVESSIKASEPQVNGFHEPEPTPSVSIETLKPVPPKPEEVVAAVEDTRAASRAPESTKETPVPVASEEKPEPPQEQVAMPLPAVIEPAKDEETITETSKANATRDDPASNASTPNSAQPSTSAAPVGSSSIATSTSSIPAPSPVAPVAKTWATLAAAGSRKPAPTASSSSSASRSPNTQSASLLPSNSKPVVFSPTAQLTSPYTLTMIQTINTNNCFVKGVTYQTDEKELKSVLTSKFGPIAAIDVVKEKACAFLEFNSVEAARRAIAYCLPVTSGGHGEVLLPKCGSSLIIEPKKKGGNPQGTSGGVGRDGGAGGGGGERSNPGREFGGAPVRSGKVGPLPPRQVSGASTAQQVQQVAPAPAEEDKGQPASNQAQSNANQTQHKKKGSKSKSGNTQGGASK